MLTLCSRFGKLASVENTKKWGQVYYTIYIDNIMWNCDLTFVGKNKEAF